MSPQRCHECGKRRVNIVCPKCATKIAASAKVTDLAPETREFLTICVEMVKKSNRASKAPPFYFGPMDLVLREGESFTPAEYDAARWRFEGTPRNCFSDAFDLAISWPELTYVEGYAASGVHRPWCLPGVHHAWCVTEDGTVVDPTWAANGHFGGEYLGVRFPNDFVLDVLAKKMTYGVLDHEPLWSAPLSTTLPGSATSRSGRRERRRLGMRGTFTVRGAKIRTASTRRFLVVACRPDDFPGKRWDYEKGAYVDETFRAFPPVVIRRSDDYATARKAKGKYGHPAGGWCVVVDTTTGEEV